MKFVKSFLLALILTLTVFGLASASYIGPNRTVTTTTWERQYCNYRATTPSPWGQCFLTLYESPGSCPSTSSVAGYFSPGPLACGSSWPGTCGSTISCSIVLLTGGTQGCSNGETGCTETTSTSTYPPATVSGTTVCTLPGNAGWCRGTATLNLSGNEPLAPAYSLTTFEGSPGTLCSAPSCAWTFPEGNTSLNYWVHSTYGDTSTMASASMMVDSVAPILTLTIPPANGSNGWYISPVTLTGSGSDATSGLASIRYRLDGGAWTSGASASVPNGVHVVEFQISDVAGNITSESHTVSVDTTPPTVTVTLPTPQGTAGWYTSGLQFSATGNDANSGVQGVAYSLDAGATWQAGPLSLTEGRYTIITRVTDWAGNVTTSTNTVDVDPTPPQSAFTTPPEGSTTVVHGSFTMSGQTLDLTSGPAAAEISVDGGITWQPLVIMGGTWSYTWDTNAVPNGTYTLLARSRDVAGNEEHTASVTVIVANRGPEVSVTESWWLWEEAKISIDPSILPVTGSRIVIFDGGGHHTRTYNFNVGDLPHSLKWDGVWDDGLYAPSGAFVVTVTAWDAFGNTGQATGTVRIPEPLPTPTVVPPEATGTSSPELAALPTSTTAPAIVQVLPTPTATPIPTPPPAPVSEPPAPTWPVTFTGSLVLLFALVSLLDPRPTAWRRLARTKNPDWR